MRQFEDPTSKEEAISRIETLGSEVEVIRHQLGDKNKTNDRGERMTVKEYRDWRSKAAFAQSCKINEYRHIKGWLRKHYPETCVYEELNDTEKLLVEAYHVMRNMGFALDWKVDPEQQEGIDWIQYVLLKRGAIE